MPIPKQLLNILSCPKCNGKLHDEGNKVTCRTCRLRFPIENDVPNLNLEYAEKF
ncbi:MAG: Trm112 family protein [Candidatus Aenigmarchaeota archaeon]|nr:Trm112 family protein [Candidatus Aenigmarchaeota archaeon]